MWYSGPHLGTPSDIALFEENRPPLMPGEQLLADKAYVKDEWNSTLIAPIKNKKGCIITADQAAFNDIIGWYRASIEHSFGSSSDIVFWIQFIEDEYIKITLPWHYHI